MCVLLCQHVICFGDAILHPSVYFEVYNITRVDTSADASHRLGRSQCRRCYLVLFLFFVHRPFAGAYPRGTTTQTRVSYLKNVCKNDLRVGLPKTGGRSKSVPGLKKASLLKLLRREATASCPHSCLYRTNYCNSCEGKTPLQEEHYKGEREGER